MNDKSALHALQHAIKQDQALKPGEIKEAFLRHVLSNPYDKSSHIAALLIELYKSLHDRDSDHGVPGLPRLAAPAIGDLFEKRFREGFLEAAPDAPPDVVEARMDWPFCVKYPDDGTTLPTGLIGEMSWLLGHAAGVRLMGRKSTHRS